MATMGGGSTAEDEVTQLYEGVRPTGTSEEALLETFPGREEIRNKFHEIWGWLEEHLELSLTSEEALDLFRSLVVYDIPDGTRTTLTVRRDIDVGMDAGFYCIALLHTLRSLGAPACVIMTHTAYNRARGSEGMDRILRLVSRGARPLSLYASRHGINVHLVGMSPEYELGAFLDQSFATQKAGNFDAFFLVDYAEEFMDHEERRRDLARLPEVDVCVRHTKLNLAGGGWIPGKMLRSAFLYSQNGCVFSNWTLDELVAMGTLALLAKILNTGEGLVKMYGDVDEVKVRHQLRELQLFNRRIQLRPNPRKLFLFGSPVGLYQVYY